jgi:hypothetical protein
MDYFADRRGEEGEEGEEEEGAVAGPPQDSTDAGYTPYCGDGLVDTKAAVALCFQKRWEGKHHLDKGSSVVGRHMVSRDLESASAAKYEEVGRAEYDAGLYIPEALDVPTDMSNFIILAPGEVFEVESGWTRVHFIVNDGTRYSEAGLRLGSHFLQVEVGTWPHASESVVVRARRQWRSKGFLWTEPVTSLPMQFTIDPNRPISKCR